MSGTVHATAASHQSASGARRTRGALADDVRLQKVCTVLSHSAPKWSEARTHCTALPIEPQHSPPPRDAARLSFELRGLTRGRARPFAVRGQQASIPFLPAAASRLHRCSLLIKLRLKMLREEPVGGTPSAPTSSFATFSMIRPFTSKENLNGTATSASVRVLAQQRLQHSIRIFERRWSVCP